MLKCLYGLKAASPSTGDCCPSCCSAPICRAPSAGCTLSTGTIGSNGCLGCGVETCKTTTTTVFKATTLVANTAIFNTCTTVRCAPATTCPLGQSWRRDAGDCCASCKYNVCADGLLCRAILASSCAYGFIAADATSGICCPTCCAAPLNCPQVPPGSASCNVIYSSFRGCVSVFFKKKLYIYIGCAAVIPKDKFGCDLCAVCSYMLCECLWPFCFRILTTNKKKILTAVANILHVQIHFIDQYSVAAIDDGAAVPCRHGANLAVCAHVVRNTSRVS